MNQIEEVTSELKKAQDDNSELGAAREESELKTENLLRDKEETANLVNGLEFEKEAALNKIKTLQASREIGDGLSEIKKDKDTLSSMLIESEDKAKVSAATLSNITAERDEMEG